MEKRLPSKKGVAILNPHNPACCRYYQFSFYREMSLLKVN